MSEKKSQILMMHAGFIHGVVDVVHGRRDITDLNTVLNAAQQNGWEDVVRVTRDILNGNRQDNLLNGMDEEDATIIGAILNGLQNPSTLPEISQQTDGSHAAPGLAMMISSAANGDVQALQALSGMAEQMSASGGDMAQVASVIRRLVNGERDHEELAEKMGMKAASLLKSVLSELAKLQIQ
ncbi:MAG: hypothetical protein ACI8P9_004313 [Parasphingorhabdus sp.]|jgi:hypothetical protein